MSAANPQHLCLSGNENCSGIRPCGTCYSVIKDRILPRMMFKVQGPFVERDAPWPQALLAAHTPAWQEVYAEVMAEVGAQLQAMAAAQAAQKQTETAGRAVPDPEIPPPNVAILIKKGEAVPTTFSQLGQGQGQAARAPSAFYDELRGRLDSFSSEEKQNLRMQIREGACQGFGDLSLEQQNTIRILLGLAAVVENAPAATPAAPAQQQMTPAVETAPSQVAVTTANGQAEMAG